MRAARGGGGWDPGSMRSLSEPGAAPTTIRSGEPSHAESAYMIPRSRHGVGKKRSGACAASDERMTAIGFAGGVS